ncbi:uncharacterized protein LOC129589667 isoform X2 [Paramacrobiotus metropolitanus]|uniref:uncharacterized protein LOC129589667 isoform X2 n=1 Tax=Paramacrobiotus metropolitanus TaxID=2943436 RepID=UPI002445F678|nr:uncharacterized protein LOC129589667 isoform X2 [Paramacrobiotus metropolitanus]
MYLYSIWRCHARHDSGIVSKVCGLMRMWEWKTAHAAMETHRKWRPRKFLTASKEEKLTNSIIPKEDSDWRFGLWCCGFVLYLALYLAAPLFLLFHADWAITATGKPCQPNTNGLISFSGGTISVDKNPEFPKKLPDRIYFLGKRIIDLEYFPSKSLLNGTDEEQLNNDIHQPARQEDFMRKWCFQLECMDMTELGYCPRTNITGWAEPEMRQRGYQAVFLAVMSVILLLVMIATRPFSNHNNGEARFFRVAILIAHTVVVGFTIKLYTEFFQDYPWNAFAPNISPPRDPASKWPFMS